MNQAFYNSVVDNMRLPGSNILFGLPVTLDTSNPAIKPGQKIALSYNGDVLAVMDVEDKWEPNKPKEAQVLGSCLISDCFQKCYLTTSLEHPGVQMLSMEKVG